MTSRELVKNIIERDRKTFFKDFSRRSVPNDIVDNDTILVADFTEYSPLHNGHFHCMKTAKYQVPDSIFVAIVPGLFERSGRGLPYILPREIRAEIAISVGADIVVEGPPMGIMGSGQYSLCLSKMFQALNTDYIPRGYKEVDGYDEILKRISQGHGIAPKPYKIVDMDTGEIIMRNKLEEDNHVIVSFSKSLKKIGFDFKDKFIFVKRIEGVSGTLIRESIANNNFDKVTDMMPQQTIEILKREINLGRCPLHELRDDERILNNANNLSFEELSNLNLFNEDLAKKFIEAREFKTVEDVKNTISHGFSTHFITRVLSVLEANVSKETVSEYITNYPSVVRVLGYKNKEILNKFSKKIAINFELFKNKLKIMKN
ncbi:MAG: nucleotidyltransferase family protein [archaeon]|nr:nucleotidyltransferase family protein [archaeon]